MQEVSAKIYVLQKDLPEIANPKSKIQNQEDAV
ncbi:hypothetical protein BH18ACI1_BH18ACI1_16190 [soil metagenome]